MRAKKSLKTPSPVSCRLNRVWHLRNLTDRRNSVPIWSQRTAQRNRCLWFLSARGAPSAKILHAFNIENSIKHERLELVKLFAYFSCWYTSTAELSSDNCSFSSWSVEFIKLSSRFIVSLSFLLDVALYKFSAPCLQHIQLVLSSLIVKWKVKIMALC